MDLGSQRRTHIRHGGCVAAAHGSPPQSQQIPTPVRFSSLELFVTLCPALVSFGAVIDSALPIPAHALISELSNNSNEQCKLKHLSLGHSPLKQTYSATAAYLSAMFPRLCIIESQVEGEEEGVWPSPQKAWRVVAELVPVIAAVWEQERGRATAPAASVLRVVSQSQGGELRQ